jgi:hypothetical protein
MYPLYGGVKLPPPIVVTVACACKLLRENTSRLAAIKTRGRRADKLPANRRLARVRVECFISGTG